MKRILLLSVLAAFIAGSCATKDVVSKYPVTKRKYNKGYHVSFGGKKKKGKTTVSHFDDNVKPVEDVSEADIAVTPSVSSETIMEEIYAENISKEREINTAPDIINHVAESEKKAKIRIEPYPIWQIKKLLSRITEMQDDDTGEPNGPAITSFVLALVGLIVAGIPLGILAVIFGIIGLSKSEVTGTGKGLAIAGIVIGLFDVIAVLIYLSTLPAA